MRAIVIGFPKAGTTTIHRACQRSKLRSAHWRTPEGYCGQLIYASFSAGGDPLERFSDYDVITQADVCQPGLANYWPNLDFEVLAAIRRHHPECLFILNRRNPHKIVESMSRHGSLRRRIVQTDIIGLPKGVGGNDADLVEWIERHYAACAVRFSEEPHYVDLDIEASDAREKLSSALGVELRWWGVANSLQARTKTATSETESVQPVSVEIDDRTVVPTIADVFTRAERLAPDVSISKPILDFLYTNTRFPDMPREEWEEKMRFGAALDHSLRRFVARARRAQAGAVIDSDLRTDVQRQFATVPATLALAYHGGFSRLRRRLFSILFPKGTVIAANGEHAATDGAAALFAARQALLEGGPALMAPDGRFGKPTATLSVLGAGLPVTDSAPFLAHATRCNTAWFDVVRTDDGFTLQTIPGPRCEDGEPFAEFRTRLYRFFVERLEAAFTGDPRNLILSSNWQRTFAAMLSGKVHSDRRKSR